MCMTTTRYSKLNVRHGVNKSDFLNIPERLKTKTSRAESKNMIMIGKTKTEKSTDIGQYWYQKIVWDQDPKIALHMHPNKHNVLSSWIMQWNISKFMIKIIMYKNETARSRIKPKIKTIPLTKNWGLKTKTAYHGMEPYAGLGLQCTHQNHISLAWFWRLWCWSDRVTQYWQLAAQ